MDMVGKLGKWCEVNPESGMKQSAVFSEEYLLHLIKQGVGHPNGDRTLMGTDGILPKAVRDFRRKYRKDFKETSCMRFHPWVIASIEDDPKHPVTTWHRPRRRKHKS